MPAQEFHGFDNEKQVFFYENEFYCLSNFSSFAVIEDGITYMTSEHLYQSKKFTGEIREQIMKSLSAHDALRIANKHRDARRADWNDVKLGIMKEILLLKVAQHPYIKKKLLDTGGREIIENSWRDNFWGWGENKDGKNHLGKLWMEVREQVKGQNL